MEATLFHFYLIVIPTTIYNAPAPADIVDGIRTEVKAALAKAFGGYTETQSMGGYVAQSGELIEEMVYSIKASFSVENDELVEALASKVKTVLNQETVMVQKDHEVFFI